MVREIAPLVTPLLHFLIVDDVDENRFLVRKALGQHYPDANVSECIESGAALAAVADHEPTAIIVHRSLDLNGPAVIRALRAITNVPILMVSGRESCPDAIAAGANAFLNYDSWRRIGTVMDEIRSPAFVRPLTASPFEPQRDFLGWRAAS